MKSATNSAEANKIVPIEDRLIQPLANTKLAIRISLILAVVLTTITFILNRRYEVLYPLVGTIVGFTFSLAILKSHFTMGRLVFLTTLNLVLIFVSDMGGPTNNTHFYFFALICYPLLCFSKYESKWMWSAILLHISSFIFCLVKPPNMFTALLEPTPIENLIDGFLSVFALLYLVWTAIKRVQQLNDEIHGRESSLIDQSRLATI